MTKISLETDMSVLLWEVYLLISASIFPGSADRQSGRATYMAFRQKRQLPQYIPLLLSKAMWGKWVVRGSTVFPEEFGCIWRLWFLHLEYKAGTEGKEREKTLPSTARFLSQPDSGGFNTDQVFFCLNFYICFILISTFYWALKTLRANFQCPSRTYHTSYLTV